MKRENKLALFLSLLFIICIFPSRSLAFNDINNHWSKPYVDDLSKDNILTGYGDGSFRPNEYMTRVEFYSLINNLAGFDKTYAVSFSDVKTSDWYYNEVAKGIKAGYIIPTTGRLYPNRNISRQEVMEIVGRLYNLNPRPEIVDQFIDSNRVSSRAKGYVGALVDDRIVAGYPNDRIEPNRPMTRGEVAKILVTATDRYGQTKLRGLSDSQIIFGPRNLYE